MPEFQQRFLEKTLMPFATNISKQEFTPYTGQMTAEVSPLAMGAQQYYEQVGGISQMTPEQYAARTAANMNPYQSQVVDATVNRLQRERDIARTQEEANIIRSGAFGGDRRAVYEAEQQAAFDVGMGQTIANLMQQGYSQAQAQTMAQLQQGQGAALAAAGGLEQLGRLQQATEQARLDAQMQEFMREQQMPYQQLGALATAASGIPTMTTQTTSSRPGLIGYLGALGAAGQGLAALGSDRRLKKNINPLAEINGVKYYTWEWNDAAKAAGFGEQPRSGVIADELKEIHPDLVFRGDDGYLRVDYAGLNERQKEYA
jgi:hypothetical protein